MKPSALGAILGAALATGACAGVPAPVSVPEPEPASVAASLFLIGDAGAARPGDRTLAAVAAAADPATATVVFLGDNVYPRGIPPAADPAHPEAVRRLDMQVAIARTAGVRTVLIAGNHDWARGAADGWARVARQDSLVRALGDGRAELLPGGGCPGPALRDLPGGFRLVALDTQWWLHGGPRPAAACAFADSAAVVAGLRDAIASAPGPVVVVGHHPLRSHGVHGGHFRLVDHLFPLREWKPWFWLPLPLLGSVPVVARRNGISRQDRSNARYRALLGALGEAFRAAPPLAYAAGHDHSLQVLTDPFVPTVIVSGAGYDGHVDPVGRGGDTRFAAGRSGYVRLDRLRDGRVRLGVVVVDRAGAREVHGEWLSGPRTGSPP